MFCTYIRMLGRSKVEGRRGEKQFSQSCNPVSCPGPHNLHHSVQSVTVRLWREQRARMSASQHPRSRTQRREGLPSVPLQLRCHGRKWLWVMKESAWVFGFLSSGFVLCEKSVCNPQRKTTLKKQPRDRLRPLYEKAGF